MLPKVGSLVSDVSVTARILSDGRLGVLLELRWKEVRYLEFQWSAWIFKQVVKEVSSAHIVTVNVDRCFLEKKKKTLSSC